MPRISDGVLNTVVYLYKDVSTARSGQAFGGTGFLVGVSGEGPIPAGYSYVITNWHVAVQAGASVVRLNTLDGNCDIFEFDPSEWEFIPGTDIAGVPIHIDVNKHNITIINTVNFLTKEAVSGFDVGPGDEVLMVGRFIDHDGGATNKPAARFGHLSVMPTPIKQNWGWTAESYCVDIHSRSGYSGSPVFAYRTDTLGLRNVVQSPEQRVIRPPTPTFFGLLGIHWGQFPELWELADTRVPAESEESLIITGQYVKGVSGMTCVLPARHIVELLNVPRFKQERDRTDADLLESYKRGEI